MVVDISGASQVVPSSNNNPQNIYVLAPKLLRNFKFSGLLNSMHSITEGIGSEDPTTIAFSKGNAEGVLEFTSTTGYLSGKINKNHGECAANGFMQDAKDFRNIEYTCYIYLVNALSSGFFRILARGGNQFGMNNCESSAVGIDLGYDGKFRALKIRRYPDISNYTKWTGGIGDLEGRWIGFKAIFHNVQDNQAVKYKLYLDTNESGKWEKYLEIVDNGRGELGGTGSVCNGKIGQPITWGAPKVFFKWYSIADPDGVLLRNISLREINPVFISGGSPTIPTTAQLRKETPEGNLKKTLQSLNVSGTSPATCDKYGVLARYATGRILHN